MEQQIRDCLRDNGFKTNKANVNFILGKLNNGKSIDQIVEDSKLYLDA